MFPVSDVIPSRTTPYVTLTLIALNTLAFAYELHLTDRALRILLHEHGLVPAIFSWGSVVTSMFLHAGWVHVLANMISLWIFGDNVEDCLGHGRYLLFYIGCGAAAALAHAAVNPGSSIPLIGASGAVAGVMGAYFVLYPRSRVLIAVFIVFYLDLVEIPAVFLLGIWFVLQLFSGAGSIGATAADGGTAFVAHAGGLVVGATVGAYVRGPAIRARWASHEKGEP